MTVEDIVVRLITVRGMVAAGEAVGQLERCQGSWQGGRAVGKVVGQLARWKLTRAAGEVAGQLAGRIRRRAVYLSEVAR